MENRLVIHRLVGEGSSRVGSSIEIRMSGMPRRWGLANWSKKLRFMVSFRRGCGWLWWACWMGC